jgi:hypothetical protein
VIDKKAAIRAYKERKPNRGVYAVRCVPTGQVWVGSSPTLDAARNRLSFALNMGKHDNRELVEAWKAHGEAAFSIEVLEKLDEDILPMSVNDLLKEKKLEWAKKLDAPALL